MFCCFVFFFRFLSSLFVLLFNRAGRHKRSAFPLLFTPRTTILRSHDHFTCRPKRKLHAVHIPTSAPPTPENMDPLALATLIPIDLNSPTLITLPAPLVLAALIPRTLLPLALAALMTFQQPMHSLMLRKTCQCHKLSGVGRMRKNLLPLLLLLPHPLPLPPLLAQRRRGRPGFPRTRNTR